MLAPVMRQTGNTLTQVDSIIVNLFWQKRERGTLGSVRLNMSFLRLGYGCKLHCCDCRVFMLLSKALNMVFFWLDELCWAEGGVLRDSFNILRS